MTHSQSPWGDSLDAKLARDGDFAKAESIAFMDEAIDGELKLISVADREF